MKIKLVGGSKNGNEYTIPDDTLNLSFTTVFEDKQHKTITDSYDIAEFDEENNIQLFKISE